MWNYRNVQDPARKAFKVKTVLAEVYYDDGRPWGYCVADHDDDTAQNRAEADRQPTLTQADFDEAPDFGPLAEFAV